MNTTAARQIILGHIRESLQSRDISPRLDRSHDDTAIPRGYPSCGLKDEEERIRLFDHRLREYDAGVHFADKNSICESVHDILQSRRKRLLAIPDGIPASWLPESCRFLQNGKWT